MTQEAYLLSELDRRLANLIRLGTVEQADYQSQRIRVRSGAQLTHWIPWASRRAGQDREWWAPDMGEQVIVLSPSGDASQAVAIGAIYQDAAPAPDADPEMHRTVYRDGTQVIYDRRSHHLTLNCVGDITVTCAKALRVSAGEQVTIEAPLIDLKEGVKP